MQREEAIIRKDDTDRCRRGVRGHRRMLMALLKVHLAPARVSVSTVRPDDHPADTEATLAQLRRRRHRIEDPILEQIARRSWRCAGSCSGWCQPHRPTHPLTTATGSRR
jgi:hypothetical protein